MRHWHYATWYYDLTMQTSDGFGLPTRIANLAFEGNAKNGNHLIFSGRIEPKVWPGSVCASLPALKIIINAIIKQDAIIVLSFLIIKNLSVPDE